MKQDKETLEQQKFNSWTPMGSTKDRTSSPNQLDWKFLEVLNFLCASIRLKGWLVYMP